MPRREKVDRRRKRAVARKRSKVRARARREEGEAADDAALAEELEPLAPLFSEGGPLEAIRFDLGGLPERVAGSGAEAIACWFTEGVSSLANDAWRSRAREALEGLLHEVVETGVPEGHCFRAAVVDAIHWTDDDLGTGVAALYNVLYRSVFEWSWEHELAAGRLPGWVADAFGTSEAEVRRDQLARRRDRAAQRLALGPFHDELSPDEFPSAQAMISGPALEPHAFSTRAAEAADRDLTTERRARVASLLRGAAARERADRHAAAAFDLETIASALASKDALDQGLARLYYVRSVYRRREDAGAPTTEWPAG